MLCFIIYPADLSEDELNSPECLSRLQVQVTQFISHGVGITPPFAMKTVNLPFIFCQQEVIVSRWVSSRERVEQDDI